MKKRFTIIGFLFFIFTNSFAQIINKDSLLVDVNYLLTFYESTNPDPYSGYGGLVYYNLEKKKLLKNINTNDLDKAQFYNLLSSFLNKSGDGHTSISNPTKNISKKETNFNSPLTFKIAYDGLFVQKSSLPYKHLIGCKFISVNNIDQATIVNNIKESDHPENLFYAYFLMIYKLNSSISLNKISNTNASIFTFKFKTPKGKIISENVNFLTEDELKKQTFFEETKLSILNNSDLYGYKIIGKTAYLKIGSMSNSREYFEKQAQIFQNDSIGLRKQIDYLYEFSFHKKAIGNNKDLINEFPVLAKICADLLLEMKAKSISNLIIDLQSNQGGDNSIAWPLLYMLKGDKRFQINNDIIFSTRLSQNYLNKFIGIGV